MEWWVVGQPVAVQTTSKYLMLVLKLAMRHPFCTDDERTLPAHSMSTRGRSTEVNWVLRRPRNPQKSIYIGGGGGV